MKTIPRAAVVKAMQYYCDHGGYYEKASRNGCDSDDVANFSKNKGSSNYTYMGVICGCTPAPYCAETVSTAVLKALDMDKQAAKEALWGRWPHLNCGTLADDAQKAGKFHWSWYGLHSKGKSGEAYIPKTGDIAIFTDAWKTRDHTGMVKSCDGTYVYTMEGNSGNMCRPRSYPLTSAYLYGFCTPTCYGMEVDEPDGIPSFQFWLGVAQDGKFGPVSKTAAIRAHQKAINAKTKAGIAEDGAWGPQTYYAGEKVQYGDRGDDVYILQGMLAVNGCDAGDFDGDFGPGTQDAVEAFQKKIFICPTAVCDPYTWCRLFGYTRPAHTTLQAGSHGDEIRYMQKQLNAHGADPALKTDGDFGPKTKLAVEAFQAANGLKKDGVCGPLTWAKLD